MRAAFTPEEAGAVRNLIGQYLGLLDAGAEPGDPVHSRLFPPASLEDERLAADYASLVGSELDRHKREAAQRVLDGLGADGPVKASLDSAAAEAWLVVLTDLRLILGVRLGVTEEVYEKGPPEPPPGAGAEAAAAGFGVFQYLGALQETLVQALMRAGA